MLEAAQQDFAQLARLGDPAINTGLLAALAQGQDRAGTPLLRANLLRRSGDLAGAREAFGAYLATGGAPQSKFEAWSAVPAGLHSEARFAMAPVVVIDDFLPRERMRALHASACDREALFRDALSTNEDAPPAYDPERRRTLVDWHFEHEREFFERFAVENLNSLQAALGLGAFTLERVELKMTNHVDGGFFKTHCDNHQPYAAAGRAITWLYYFGEDAPRYRGGDLYIRDSAPTEGTHSPAWFTRIAARPNRFVAFPSWFHHAVGPTELRNGTFAQGRFAVSCHIRKAACDGEVWWE